MNLTPLQIAQYAYQAGFRGVALINAVAIALAESGGNPNALNPGTPSVPENSQGLWQINLNAHPQYQGSNLYDPATNAAAAFAVSNGGANFNPWSTFTNGAYQNFVATATSVAAQVNPNLPGLGGISLANSTPPPSLPQVKDPVQAAKDTLAGVAASVNGVGQTLASTANGIIGPIGQFASDVTSLVKFVGDPKVTTGLAMAIIGGIIVILGIVLFGLSLIPSSDAARAVRAATAVAV